MSLALRPYQLEAVERAREVLRAGKRRVLIVAPTGCHAKGQRILTYMGGFVRVERVRVGQKLWGHDGQARTVLQLCRGRGEMFEVSPNSGGKPFVVNLDHIMVLAIGGQVVDISLRDWFKLPARVRSKSELVRLPMSGVARSTFRITPLGEDDYYGFTLDGDGRYVLDDYTVTHNSGKTVVAAHIIHSAAERGKRVLFVAHRRELINQSYNKLLEAGLAPEQLGVIMASDKRRNPGAVVQVASVDTLRNRAKPRADIVFVDEAHRATAQSYVSLQTDYPEGVHLGLTATPYRADGRGLGECYDEIVQVASPKELIEMGFLVEPSVLTVPADKLPDLSGVKTSRGDYDATQLEAAVNRAPLVGSIIEHWLQYANGVPTVAFATSVEHSKSIAARFVEAGIAAEHLDGTTPQDERDAILGRLERGEIKVLANMGVLCLDAQTEILTSEGWKGIDSISETDEVAGWADGIIQFERPHAIHKRDTLPDECMVVLNHRSTNFRVTEGHGIVYASINNWKKKPARELVGLSLKIPAFGIAAPIHKEVPYVRRSTRDISHAAWNIRNREGLSPTDAHVEATRRVARRDSLRHKSPHELTLAECRFIGFWLGDGSKQRLKTGGIEYKIFEQAKNGFIVDWLEGVFDEMGLHRVRRELPVREPQGSLNIGRTGLCYGWSFARGTGSGSQQRDGVYAIEPYLEHDGSQLYWGLNKPQFEALLHGFWLSDGNHSAGSNTLPDGFQIYNARKALLDTIQAIAVCRGFRANLRKKRDIWVLSLSNGLHYATHPSNSLRIETLEAPERVWCVTTAAGNIVTRRHGAVTVLGNCEGWDQPSVKCAILARPTKSTGLYLQQAGRILRPYQGQRAIILDHAGNARMHGLPQQDREFTLEAKDKRNRSASPPTKTCPSCYAVLEGGFRTCPHCGLEFLVVSERAEPEEVDGKLVVMKDDSTERRAFYDELVTKAKATNRKPGWAAHKYRERYGTWPPFAWREKQPPKLDATLDEMRTEYEHLRELAEERGYKPGYVAIRFQEKFGRQIPYSAFDNRGREAKG